MKYLLTYNQTDGGIASIATFEGGYEPNMEFAILLDKLPYGAEMSDIMETGYVVNSELKFRPMRPSRDFTWNSELSVWEPDLNKVKQTQWNLVKSDRMKYDATAFSFMSHGIETDVASQQRILLNGFSAQQDPEYRVAWTTKENRTVFFSATELVQMAQQLTAFLTASHVYSQKLKREIFAATTPEAVQAVTWVAPA